MITYKSNKAEWIKDFTPPEEKDVVETLFKKIYVTGNIIKSLKGVISYE